MQKNIDEILQMMNEERGSLLKRLLLLLPNMLVIVAILCLMYYAREMALLINEKVIAEKIGVVDGVALILSFMAVVVAVTPIAIGAIKQKKYFIVYKVKDTARMDEMIMTLKKQAKKEGMQIRDIDISIQQKKVYLTIYF